MARSKRLAALVALALAAAPSSLASQESAAVDSAPEATATEATEATEAPAPTPTLPIPLSITTSGGVSLGGYQAGFLYYLTEVIKNNPSVFQPKLLTGSSAGTINSIIALISLGNPPEPNPQKSLFYSSWTTPRFDDLLDVDNAPPLALSSRRAMEMMSKRLGVEWVEGFEKSLDIVVGAAATRVVGRSVGVGEGLAVPRQEEKFVFRVRGRGKGVAPLVTNYVDQTWGVEQPLLPFAEANSSDARSAAADFAVVQQVMFASSAFPLAFPPQKVGFCMTSPEMVDPQYLSAFRDCPEPRFQTEFMDGSIFDRNPIGLAHRTARAGLVEGGVTLSDTQWRSMPDMRLGVLPENVLFLYLDAEHTSYPEPPTDKSADHIAALFPAFGAYSQEYVRAAQAKELYTLVDENPHIRTQLEITFRDLPSASGLLFNFFGFFDRKFRVFDFYLGMHDARRYLLDTLTPRVRKLAGEEVDLVLPEEAGGRRGADSWAPFFCLRDVVDGDAKYQGACMSRDLQDFRILLQVSLDLLYDQCRLLQPDETIDHIHCKRAIDQENPPRVHGPAPGDTSFWKVRPEETSFQHTLRLLEEYEFWFRDLGLDRDESWLAMSMIREQLAGDLDAFVKKLPPRERIILRTIGKPALNFFKYQPPQAIIYLAGGMGAELGTSLSSRFVATRWVRFNIALQTRGLSQLISPAKNVWAVTPLFGLELEIPQLSNAAFQVRLGARVGFQFSTGDRGLDRDCDFGDFDNDAAQCSAPLGQALVVFSFYERIRVQGGLEWFPYFFPPMSRQDENRWNGFIEVGWQWISPF
jgi:predicted acylesterase/phospholipase RssA